MVESVLFQEPKVEFSNMYDDQDKSKQSSIFGKSIRIKLWGVEYHTLPNRNLLQLRIDKLFVRPYPIWAPGVTGNLQKWPPGYGDKRNPNPYASLAFNPLLSR